jgi:hypothetical protein
MHLATMGQISILFYAIENMRPKVMGNRIPSLRNYDTLPEKALKGSSLSHSARYVVTLTPEFNVYY